MYLVAMLDPDTPSFDNPLCRHWVHFIFGNVKVGLFLDVVYLPGPRPRAARSWYEKRRAAKCFSDRRPTEDV